jgi:two-component system, OmpR family, response regulator ResD
MARVLIVEDDLTVSDVVTRYLVHDGHEVATTGDGREAVARVRDRAPDLVVLDLMLPGLDGFEVCREIRERAAIPVIILTARDAEDDRICGFEVGADDYVVKPFSPRELVSRVRAVLRRSHVPAAHDAMPAVLEAGPLRIDVPSREVHRDGAAVGLTAREFDLLAFMVVHARTVFSREELLERVWGFRYGDTSTVTVHIRRLREKVESDPSDPALIRTVWGVGYRFDP